MVIFFIQNLKDKSTPNPNSNLEETSNSKKKNTIFYISKGCLLGFIILFFNGILASSLSYALPIVMYDIYGWFV